MPSNDHQKLMRDKVSAAASDFNRRAVPKDVIESEWLARDGWPLRRLDWQAEAPRGSILFMTGRADFYEKYLETFHDFHSRGWNVTTADWRGQGGSGRCGPHPHVGHIEDFAIWIDDLTALVAEWRASHPGPHILVGHSMGGHLLLRALTEQRVHPDAAILSAPMLAPAGGGMPEWTAQLIAKFMCGIGRATRRAWKVSEKPLEPEVLRQGLLTHDADRYSDEFFWFHERPFVRLGPASWRWVERAYASTRLLRDTKRLVAMDVPLLCLATSTDELVDHPTIERAMRLLPNAQMKLFGQECAHEILREADEVRDDALQSCFEFLDQVAPKT